MKLRSLILATTIMAGAVVAQAQDETSRTIYGVDISGSSTFLHEQLSADRAARHMEGQIAVLPNGHDLWLISIGDPGMGKRAIDIRTKISKRRQSRADRMAKTYGGYIRALPELVQNGTIKAQDSTSIIDFFYAVEPICSAGNTRLILFTDAVEYSHEVDGKALMAGRAHLPKPSRPMLKGCHVEMHGVGQLKSSLKPGSLERRLIPLWRDWLKAAGASSIRVTGSFFSL